MVTTTGTNYVDLRTSLRDPSHQASYDRMVNGLEAAFAKAYAGTTLGGFDNLKPLRFRCSVSRFSGHVQQCVWVFAGSHEDLDPRDGGFSVDAEMFVCPMLVDATGEQLVTRILAPEAEGAMLDRVLTGNGGTVRTALNACWRAR